MSPDELRQHAVGDTVVMAEQVLVRCPVCGWESAAVMVDPAQPNGRWFASREGASLYRSHFNYEHRPAPEVVVLEAALAGGTEGS